MSVEESVWAIAVPCAHVRNGKRAGPLLSLHFFWSPRCWSVSPHFHAMWGFLLQFLNSTNTLFFTRIEYFTHLYLCLSMLNFSIFLRLLTSLSSCLHLNNYIYFFLIFDSPVFILCRHLPPCLWGTDYKRRGSYLYHVSKDLCQDFLCTLRAEACLEYSSQPRSSALHSRVQ